MTTSNARKKRDGSSRSTAAASRCWLNDDDEQCTMDSRPCSLAGGTFVCGGPLPLCRTQSVRSDAWRNQGLCDVDNDGEGCQRFVQNCLHCVATITGEKVPRPLGTQLHATKPNEILHFDFLFIGLSRDGKYQYLLLLKNELSGHLWLLVCRTFDSAATVDALMR
jgi:hypothetical protein